MSFHPRGFGRIASKVPPWVRGALGYTRNRKTKEKFIQNRKTANKIGQNRKPHTKLYTQIGPNRKKKIGKTKNYIGYQNRKLKPLIFFTKTENQILKNENSANRIEHQNRKTEAFWHKNRKTDQKNIQNRKTEKPNPPLLGYGCSWDGITWTKPGC